MKTIYKYSILLSALLLSAGCVREEISEENAYVEITARMEHEPDTRTTLSGLENGMYYPLWAAADEIAVYADADKEPSKFIISSGEGSTVATFSGGRSGRSFVAVYPYDIAGSISDGTLLLTLPSTQQYVKDSFGQGSFPMLAAGTASDGLSFMNLCSVLKISLTGNASVRGLTVTANDEDTFLSGSACVVIDRAAGTVLTMSEGGSRSVTLECKGVELTYDSPADFHVVIPAQEYEGGFTIEIDAYTETVTKVIDSDLVLERSQIRHVKGLEIELGTSSEYAKEKAALIALYDSLGGDQWTHNENWCTDAPLSDWYEVSTDDDGHVVALYLIMNNAKGTIPKEIGDLKYLQRLYLNYNNGISGTIPKEIGELTELRILDIIDCNLSGPIPHAVRKLENLESLCLHDNRLEGSIPKEIGNLKKLREINLCGNRLEGEIPSTLGDCTNLSRLLLNDNLLTGELPAALAAMPSLEILTCFNNRLSGKIPEELVSNETLWRLCWAYITEGNDFDMEGVRLLGPSFSALDIDGNRVTSYYLYKEYDYVLFTQWYPGYVSATLLETLKDIADRYSDKKFGIVGYAWEDFSDEGFVREMLDAYGLDFPFIHWMASENTIVDEPFWYYNAFYPYYTYQSNMIADSKGNIVYYDLEGLPSRLKKYVYELYGDVWESDELYVSSDYSADGVVGTLQTAATGNGIDIVLMGDGYSDRQIADGTYEADMVYMYENIFTEEPFRTYKDMFNVHYVKVVSANEGYGEYNETALHGFFGDGTLVGGNDRKCFEYALNAITDVEMDEALIIVAMNSDAYAGTCYMYYPESVAGTYGSGPAVAYFPKGSDEGVFAQLLHHEAAGHGFAKLADEYAYEEMGEVVASVVTDTRDQQNRWGWWKNVDFTSDPSQVRWSYFLEDERYADEGLGVFEGGLTYWSGVWRPTENSIMRYNTGGFNAPSREAIWYRIHRLAYGDSWEYDYEDFVEYDAVNRSSSASAPQKSRRNYVESLEPATPPVVVGKSWKDVR